MHRIDVPSAVVAAPTPAAAGTPGYFTNGNPLASVEATILDQDWANAVQEEIAGVVLGAGGTLDKTNRGQLLAAISALIAAIPHGVQVLATAGTFTFTVPAGVTAVDVELWGGGSGSWGSTASVPSCGGGAGGYSRKRITGLTPGAGITVTVGAAGTAGASNGGAAGSGGTTSFGGYFSVTGGTAAGSIAGAGTGGTSSTGDDNIDGGTGQAPPQSASAYQYGGAGGAAPKGGAGGQNGNASVAGVAPGGAASGAPDSSALAGKAGAIGRCIVRWW